MLAKNAVTWDLSHELWIQLAWGPRTCIYNIINTPDNSYASSPRTTSWDTLWCIWTTTPKFQSWVVNGRSRICTNSFFFFFKQGWGSFHNKTASKYLKLFSSTGLTCLLPIDIHRDDGSWVQTEESIINFQHQILKGILSQNNAHLPWKFKR